MAHRRRPRVDESTSDVERNGLNGFLAVFSGIVPQRMKTIFPSAGMTGVWTY